MEYLLTAATPFSIAAAHRLLAGTTPGVTGMASAFKDAAGCGSLDLTATPVDGGYRLSRSIRWASNLYDDSLMITAASTEAGEKLIVALPLNTSGVVLGDHFSLLAMGSTASSYLKLQDAQVLSADFLGFLTAVRPTFLVLQSAMCLGLTQTTLAQKQTRIDRGELGFRRRGRRSRREARGCAAGVGQCGGGGRRAAAAQHERLGDVAA